MFSRKAQEDSNAGAVAPFVSLWCSTLKLWIQVVDRTSKSVEEFDVREGIAVKKFLYGCLFVSLSKIGSSNKQGIVHGKYSEVRGDGFGPVVLG